MRIELRTPLSSEEVFDKYLIPYILGNEFTEENIKILANRGGIDCGESNFGYAGKNLKEILKEDIDIITSGGGGKSYSPNAGIQNVKLDQIFKEKYQGQFEIDLENKILYRTVKTYKNFPTSIIDVKYTNNAGKKYKKHPTAKPVEVLEYLLDHYTEENDLVLDMTSGSGSTAVACKNMNRNFVGSEISKVWYDVAQQRINDVNENSE